MELDLDHVLLTVLLDIAGLGICCHCVNQWRRDVTPVYMRTVGCQLSAVNHLYVPCNCEPYAGSWEFAPTMNC